MSASFSSSNDARLPPEILSQIFLHADPHTLYTSVRALSRSWKECVEERLLASQFETGLWRVGLRISRKAKVGAPWRGGTAGGRDWEAPGAMWSELKKRAKEHASSLPGNSVAQKEAECVAEARRIYTNEVLSRPGALEDELEPALSTDDVDDSSSVVHVIPLSFKRYDGASTTLQFATANNEMHALFENGNGNGDPSRLDLDFGIVWRFPGDGQEDDGWGEADPENGWLSRFYCSSFDVEKQNEDEDCDVAKNESLKMRSTPLARRLRRVITQAASDDQEDDDGEMDDATLRRSHPSQPLEWSDRGHEYASLALSLGTEFFVRRSARANQLVRRLEVAAAQSRQEQKYRRGRSMVSYASTPRRSPRQSNTPSRSDTCFGPSTPLSQSILPTRRFCPSGYSTGTSTPSMARSMTPSINAPWKSGGGSYALVASTPPSKSPSRRGSFVNGPRVVRAVPMTSGSLAPLPSVNVSGYSSVQHQAPVDEKEAEMKPGVLTEDDECASSRSSPSSSSSSLSSPPVSKGASNMALSGHHSVPRAHFSAAIVRIHRPHNGEWLQGDAYGRESWRNTALRAHDARSVWEWCR